MRHAERLADVLGRQRGSRGEQAEPRWERLSPSDRDEKHLREYALNLGEFVIGQRDLWCRPAKALHSYGPHLFGDHPPTAIGDGNLMQPARPLYRRQRQNRHQRAAGQVQVERRGDDKSRPVLTLLATAYRVEVAEPNRGRLNGWPAHLDDHSSVIGASATARSSASAR